MKIQRYSWEDALIKAQTDKVISNGALLVALKLARAINWVPAGNRASGLYWKNDDALKAVGCGRASFYRHRSELFTEGFFAEERGNLIPTMPEKSHLETESSHLETIEYPGDKPYSVDTYREDAFSVTNTKTTVVADAPTVRTSILPIKERVEIANTPSKDDVRTAVSPRDSLPSFYKGKDCLTREGADKERRLDEIGQSMLDEEW